LFNHKRKSSNITYCRTQDKEKNKKKRMKKR